jgi:hypothetical protein
VLLDTGQIGEADVDELDVFGSDVGENLLSALEHPSSGL